MSLRILVTNDDGYRAKGIQKLAEAAKKYGEVFVIAPKEEQSAKSHSIKVRQKIKFKKVKDIVEGVDTYYANSTPADCVRIAYFHLGANFDIVLSGVNEGYNLGEDIVYSGTCAAATEAAMLGKVGIAFSCKFKALDDIDYALERSLDFVFKNKLYEKWPLLNINMPTEFKKIIFTRQGKTHYVSNYSENRGKLTSIGRPLESEDSIDKSDVDLTYKSYITITPLTFNRTNEEILHEFLDEFEEK